MAEYKKRLVIIDGKSVFYRGYYAMPNLSTKEGISTGGVYGFAVMALEVIRKLKPDYVAVAWDKPKTNIRKRLELYPKYKAGRKPPPPDFYDQIPILHELLDAFGWPLYELDDYEADDIMGTLAVQAKDRDIETMLVTSDMDVLQLVNTHTHAYLLKTGLSKIDLYDPKTFIAKYNLDPSQFLDLKALMGDSSDNIPGVPGVGPKTASELLRDFKTLDGVYDNLDLMKNTLAEKLRNGKDLAYLSHKLAEIWLDAPIKLNLEEVDGRKAKPELILEILNKLEFRTLVRQLPEIMQVESGESVSTHGLSNFVVQKQIIDSQEKLDALDLEKASKLVIFSRSNGKHGVDPHLFFISPKPKSLLIFDLEKIDKSNFVNKLKPLIDSPDVKKIGYDIKNTIEAFASLDIELAKIDHDVLIASFLLNSLRRDQSLKGLAAEELSIESVDFDNLSPDELIDRADQMSGIIWALYEKQKEDLANTGKLDELAKTIEWPIIPVLAKMEDEGILLDTKYLNNFSKEINDLIDDLEQKIYTHAEIEFNISSPLQLSEVLFEKLQIPSTGIKRGKSAFSTAASELEKLRGMHPIIDLISSYREVTKLKSTYVDALPKMVDENSRLHTTFNLTIAQTGRLSSTDPNLQNIPVRTDLGKRIRTAFIAGPGNLLISADYSQFELRIAAHLSKDEDVIEQFNNDVDVHSTTAALIYNRDIEDVTKNMRREAKVVNFGVMYGLGPHGLASGTGMNYGQAKHFIDRFFEVRPKLKAYIESVRKQAIEDGYVEDIFGRRRPTPDIKSTNFAVRESAVRAAVNMPFQGSAADIMKKAMIDLDEKLKGTSARMLLQIHDSVLVEVAEADAQMINDLVKKTMEDTVKLSVKLTVDSVIAKNWGLL
ncbi:MAG: DNA polymerase I [Candidatus Saccharibacteria bacterium]